MITHQLPFRIPFPSIKAHEIPWKSYQRQVRQVVRRVRPQHVMVELCLARRQRLEAQRTSAESCSILPGVDE